MARWTVLRSWPVRRAISRIESRSTKRILRISAHLSTSSKSYLLASVADRARIRTPPDALRPSGGGIFDRQRWGIFQPARSRFTLAPGGHAPWLDHADSR